MDARQESAIADFAESLLLESLENPQEALKASIPSNQQVSDEVPDISDIEISDELVSSMLTGKSLKEQKEVKKETTKEIPLRDIVLRLAEEVARLKKQVSEMTTVGAIGVNMAPKKEKKKKVSKDDILRRVRALRGE